MTENPIKGVLFLSQEKESGIKAPFDTRFLFLEILHREILFSISAKKTLNLEDRYIIMEASGTKWRLRETRW